MTINHPGLAEVLHKDPRYPLEAYEFVFAALAHTQKRLGRMHRGGPDKDPGPEHHVSGPELLAGVRDLALRDFGLMARTVFRLWGINRTGDFGNIVFNLVEAGLMSKTDRDTHADFENVYDLDQALVQEFRIQLEDGEA